MAVTLILPLLGLSGSQFLLFCLRISAPQGLGGGEGGMAQRSTVRAREGEGVRWGVG